MKMLKKLTLASAFALIFATSASADGWRPRQNSCHGLPSWSQLHTALQNAIGGNGGLGLHMWATIIANDGTVCAVAFSGADYTSQWLASRVISAQKANTANGLNLGKSAPPSSSPFSGIGLALSTANLYSAVQPGGSLFGLQFSNPVDPDAAYEQKNGKPVDPSSFGKPNDPMVGDAIGGVNVFGGGLALYKAGGVKVGGVGVSGDTSCTDHFVAWKVRNALGLDHLRGVGGVAGDADHPDNIIYDFTADQTPNVAGNKGVSAGGFGHPTCLNGTPAPSTLPAVQN